MFLLGLKRLAVLEDLPRLNDDGQRMAGCAGTGCELLACANNQLQRESRQRDTLGQDPHAVLTPTANIWVVHSISQADRRNHEVAF